MYWLQCIEFFEFMAEKIRIKTLVDRLEFRFPFHIAHGTRTGTDAVFILLEWNGHFGIGEATLPPYLQESIESTLHFFHLPEVQELSWPLYPPDVFDHLNQKVSGYMPAKAALDMALWQLYASIHEKSVGDALSLSTKQNLTPHFFTIDVSDTETLRRKFDFAVENGFNHIKLKLDGECDERMIEDYLRIGQFPFAVDANQAWSDFNLSRSKTNWLKSEGCLFIEQPFKKEDVSLTKRLVEESDMTIMADEALQLPSDFSRISEAFNAINLKLQKCGGLTPAMTLLEKAAHHGIPVMVGCMSESSIGCNAGEWIAPYCKWADLDGPFLIRNDREIRQKLDDLMDKWNA